MLTTNLLGIINGALGDFNTAKQLFIQVSNQNNANLNNPLIELKAQTNLAVVLQFQSQEDIAISILEKTLKLSQKNKFNELSQRSSNNIGVIRLHQGDFKEALDIFLKVLNTNTGLLPDQGFLSQLYHNIGATYDSLGNYERSIEYFLKALELKKQIGNKFAIAITQQALGEVYANMGYTTLSLENLNFALDIFSELGNVYSIIYTENLIGKTYFKKGDLDKAELYFHRLLNRSENEVNIRHLVESLFYLIFCKLDDNSINLNEYLNKIAALANESDNPSLKEKSTIIDKIVKLSQDDPQSSKFDNSLIMNNSIEHIDFATKQLILLYVLDESSFKSWAENIQLPEKLYDYKSYMHPTKLLILNILQQNVAVSRKELMEFLHLKSGPFYTHCDYLLKEDVIMSMDRFIDGKVSVVYSITPKGIEIYNILKSDMAQLLF